MIRAQSGSHRGRMLLRKPCLAFRSRDHSQRASPSGFAEFWPTASLWQRRCLLNWPRPTLVYDGWTEVPWVVGILSRVGQIIWSVSEGWSYLEWETSSGARHRTNCSHTTSAPADGDGPRLSSSISGRWFAFLNWPTAVKSGTTFSRTIVGEARVRKNDHFLLSSWLPALCDSVWMLHLTFECPVFERVQKASAVQGGGKRTRWTGLLGPASPSPTLGRETETAPSGLCQLISPWHAGCPGALRGASCWGIMLQVRQVLGVARTLAGTVPTQSSSDWGCGALGPAGNRLCHGAFPCALWPRSWYAERPGRVRSL